jgi:hypothetical protein
LPFHSDGWPVWYKDIGIDHMPCLARISHPPPAPAADPGGA